MAFLTAEWRDLLMINFEVPGEILEPFVPPRTELDPFEGAHFVSAVGFRFLDTRIWGVPVPFHREFPEVNLRFYVRRKSHNGWRRGVSFIKEIIPKRAAALLARRLYHEPYETYWMRHRVRPSRHGAPPSVEYWWYPHVRLNHMAATVTGGLMRPEEGAFESYIIDHYWGYSRWSEGDTLEYRVEHPGWRIQSVGEVSFDCDVADLYGERFVEALSGEPHSAFLASGSEVAVHKGIRI